MMDENDEKLLEVYEMLSNEFDYEELKKSERFGIKQYKDAIFRGELEGRKRHGKGVIVYKTGRVYEGDWNNDK
jgi:hypothetical protein